MKRIARLGFFILATIGLQLPSTALAATQIRYVDSAVGSDVPGNGTAGAPWQTVNYALSQIDGTAIDPVELRIAEGTYNESVVMEDWFDLLGGYQSITWDRDPSIYVTILDGNGAFHAVTMASNSRLDGFTVTGGSAQGTGDDRDGGGVFCMNEASIVVANNVIAGNDADNNGGGLSAVDCDIEIRDNVFVKNWSQDPVNPLFGDGGAVRIQGTGSETVIVDGNEFLDNVAFFSSAMVITSVNATVNGNSFGGNLGKRYTVSGFGLTGVFTNNEWIGNEGLPARAVDDLYYRVPVPTPGNLRLVNNTLSGVEAGIVVDTASGYTEQITAANNIVTGYNRGMEEANALTDITATHNLFFDNAIDFRDEGVFDYSGVNNLQLSVFNATNNVEGDPLFGAVGPFSWTDNGVYNAATFMTVLTDTAGIPRGAANGLAGAWVNPDTTQERWFLIRSSTNTTLTVWGEAASLASSLDNYRVSSLSLSNNSAALDRGSLTDPDVPADDVEGDARPGGDGQVDIGADEADPAFTPPIDGDPPTSQVQGLASFQGSIPFDVPYVVSDAEGSAVTVQLFYRLGTSGGFTDYGSFTASPISFNAPLGEGLYQFYTVATDAASNVEAAPATPDAETLVRTTFTGTRVYVVPGGAGAITGESWADAVRRPAEATGLASTFGLTEIWVAQGTYPGAVRVPAGVALYGSFLGTETTLGQRALGNETILDGNGAFHTVTMASNSRLDGFTVTGGSAQGTGDDRDGGGVFCMNEASILVANNVIAGNDADNNGGGLSAVDCDIEIRDNVFVKNWSQDPVNPLFGDGGAVRIQGTGSETVIVDGNEFLDNVAFFSSAMVITSVNATVNGNSFGGNLGKRYTVSGFGLTGVFTNNEWIGNEGLPARAVDDLYYRVPVPTPGNLRLVNNTLSGVEAGIVVDTASGYTEQITAANNIVTGYNRGMEEANALTDITATHNLFFDNAIDFRDEGVFDYSGVNNLQLSVFNATNNVEGDPLFGAVGPFSWTDNGVYNAATFMTVLTDTAGIPRGAANGLAGAWVNPDTTQERWFLIRSSTNTTLTVWGEAASLASSLDNYRVSSLSLSNNSAALDRGSLTDPDVPADDVEGDARPGGDGQVDIGADEADPAFTPPIDGDPPTSQVQGLASFQGSIPFDVPYVVSDAEGSAVTVQLFYRLGTSGGFTDYGSFTASPISFNAPLGEGLYQFYTVATDAASNVEPAPGAPDAETLVRTTFSGTRIYVVPGGAGAVTGENWANAVRTPAETTGIAAAFGVNEIWVAQGAYTGAVTLTDGAQMYGSFLGTETALGERTLGNETTLTGNGAFHTVTMASNSRLDGFTVTGGAAQGTLDDRDGGGLFCKDKTGVVVANNVVAGNNADNNGGGLSSLNCAIDIHDNVFAVNWVNDPVNPFTGDGGAVRIQGTGSETVIVDGNAFLDNVAYFSSAMVITSVNATINGNRFGGNRGTWYTVSGFRLTGVVSNNEWNGNDGLPSDTVDDFHYRTPVPLQGNLRLLNNKLSGVETGIVVSTGAGYTEQITATNNIVTGYVRAMEEENTQTDIAATHNLFFGNAVDFRDEGVSDLSGAAAVNSGVPEASANIDGDPSFLPLHNGTLDDDGSYTAGTFTTLLTDTGVIAGGAGNGLAGKWVNPDTTQERRFLIKSSTSSTLTVWGDASAIASIGDGFQVEDLHIADTSPARNQADAGHPDLPLTDIDGDPRPGPDNFADIGADEADLPSIGDRVWSDLDGDGIQDAGEPGVVAAVVYLLDDAGGFLDVTFTDVNGNYRFADLTAGTGYRVRFIPPPGHVLSPQDQSSDDSADSDANPVNGDTPLIFPDVQITPFEWDAGVVSTVPCTPPDEEIYIYSMRVSTNGNNYPIIDFMDFNQPDQVTGYNVYRSSDPALDPAMWPLVASDIVDGDEGTPNNQWVDISGDVSPSGTWYYDVAAYNNRCPAEGPR